MAAASTRRTRRGAAVTCSDGVAGSVVGVDNDANGRPQYLRIASSGGGEHLLVPLTLIQGIRDDGTVLLHCTCSDLQRWSADADGTTTDALPADAEQVGLIHLHEERLVPHTDLRTVGEIEVRTELEEFPGRLEVAALREEVEVEHVPMGHTVKERVGPWEEDGVLVVPVYEEQLVVVKRLVMREQLRIRRVETHETRLFEETLRREHAVVDDPQSTGLVHEYYADVSPDGSANGDGAGAPREADAPEGGFIGHLVRRALG
jgi:uncharacterized protein (TIGR02271 family)